MSARWEALMLLPPNLRGLAETWIEAVQVLHATGTDRIAHVEHDLWRALCAAMVEAGVVTAEDCKRKLSDTSTPGTEVFKALRAWADSITEGVRP